MNAVTLRPSSASGQAVTYYGQPSVKHSPWNWLVSSYIFLAGLGGSSQIIASAADLVPSRKLRGTVRDGRYIALATAVLGGPLLIADLGTPRRWYNMLRIFRKTSPMSIGTWVLMVFGSSSAALAAVQFAQDRGYSPGPKAERAIKLVELPAALSGMAMTTYTGALLSATSTPLWAAAPRRIAAAFAASAMASGAAALRLSEQCRGDSGGGRNRGLDRIGFLAGAVELALLLSLRRHLRERGVDGALRETGWGIAYDVGAVVLGSAAPIMHDAASVFESEPAPRPAPAVAVAILAGAFLLRHILLGGGNISATRPADYFRFASKPIERAPS
jgi:protein NrfD